MWQCRSARTIFRIGVFDDLFAHMLSRESRIGVSHSANVPRLALRACLLLYFAAWDTPTLGSDDGISLQE
jgi:hypothetical protein